MQHNPKPKCFETFSVPLMLTNSSSICARECHEFNGVRFNDELIMSYLRGCLTRNICVPLTSWAFGLNSIWPYSLTSRYRGTVKLRLSGLEAGGHGYGTHHLGSLSSSVQHPWLAVFESELFPVESKTKCDASSVCIRYRCVKKGCII